MFVAVIGQEMKLKEREAQVSVNVTQSGRIHPIVSVSLRSNYFVHRGKKIKGFQLTGQPNLPRVISHFFHS